MNMETCKAAWIANLKAQPTVVPLFATDEIREIEYQASDWVYPSARVAVTFRPSLNRCGPDDADVEITCYSAEKSSKQSVHAASIIEDLYHGRTFSQSGVRFSTIIVREVTKPNRSIYAWETTVKIFCQGI